MRPAQLLGTGPLVQLAAVSSSKPLAAVPTREQSCAGALQVQCVTTDAAVPGKKDGLIQYQFSDMKIITSRTKNNMIFALRK